MERSVTATFAEELRPRFAAIQHAQVGIFIYTRERKMPGLVEEIERAALLVSRAIHLALRQRAQPGQEPGRAVPQFLALHELEPITDAKSARVAHEALDAYLHLPASERRGLASVWPNNKTRDPDAALSWIADAAMFVQRAMELAGEPVHQQQAQTMLRVAASFSAHAIINARVGFQEIMGLLVEMRDVGKTAPSVREPSLN